MNTFTNPISAPSLKIGNTVVTAVKETETPATSINLCKIEDTYTPYMLQLTTVTETDGGYCYVRMQDDTGELIRVGDDDITINVIKNYPAFVIQPAVQTFEIDGHTMSATVWSDTDKVSYFVKNSAENTTVIMSASDAVTDKDIVVTFNSASPVTITLNTVEEKSVNVATEEGRAIVSTGSTSFSGSNKYEITSEHIVAETVTLVDDIKNVDTSTRYTTMSSANTTVSIVPENETRTLTEMGMQKILFVEGGYGRYRELQTQVDVTSTSLFPLFEFNDNDTETDITCKITIKNYMFQVKLHHETSGTSLYTYVLKETFIDVVTDLTVLNMSTESTPNSIIAMAEFFPFRVFYDINGHIYIQTRSTSIPVEHNLYVNEASVHFTKDKGTSLKISHNKIETIPAISDWTVTVEPPFVEIYYNVLQTGIYKFRYYDDTIYEDVDLGTDWNYDRETQTFSNVYINSNHQITFVPATDTIQLKATLTSSGHMFLVDEPALALYYDSNGVSFKPSTEGNWWETVTFSWKLSSDRNWTTSSFGGTDFIPSDNDNFWYIRGTNINPYTTYMKDGNIVLNRTDGSYYPVMYSDPMPIGYISIYPNCFGAPDDVDTIIVEIYGYHTTLLHTITLTKQTDTSYAAIDRVTSSNLIVNQTSSSKLQANDIDAVNLNVTSNLSMPTMKFNMNATKQYYQYVPSVTAPTGKYIIFNRGVCTVTFGIDLDNHTTSFNLYNPIFMLNSTGTISDGPPFNFNIKWENDTFKAGRRYYESSTPTPETPFTVDGKEGWWKTNETCNEITIYHPNYAYVYENSPTATPTAGGASDFTINWTITQGALPTVITKTSTSEDDNVQIKYDTTDGKTKLYAPNIAYAGHTHTLADITDADNIEPDFTPIYTAIDSLKALM